VEETDILLDPMQSKFGYKNSSTAQNKPEALESQYRKQLI